MTQGGRPRVGLEGRTGHPAECHGASHRVAEAPGALTFHGNDALLQLAHQPTQCRVVGHLEGMGLTGV